MTALAPTLQAFFTTRLISQRGASPNTIAGYRDTWRLLLCFTAAQTGKNPSKLDIADLDAPLIGAFLDELETARANSPRRVAPACYHAGAPSGPSMHVPAHSAQASRTGSQMLCSTGCHAVAVWRWQDT
jgi:hypothetical protein